jgi:hypothetical protein
MRPSQRHVAFLLLLAALVAIGSKPSPPVPGALGGDNPRRGGPPPGHRYPDFGFMPPARLYEGRVFRLSQDYPKESPPAADVPAICRTDFGKLKKNWKRYLLDVRDYCFLGNVLGGDVEDDWRVENNKQNRWYHMPWQHYGPSGREGIHGLTKEAPVQVRQLAWTQTYSGGQTYAVAFYNEFGGYTLGQVWKDHQHPAKGMKKIAFPVGTVICKVLFVDIPPEQVPSLNPPLQWQGYVTENYQSTKRSIRKLSLIQMDIMVRHKDAPSGWIFGTFQYNGRRKGAKGAKTLWENLVPLGLQWGNDPDVRENNSNPQPVKTMINPKLKETVINPDAEELPPTHLGWNGRLNGPVDNPMSTCMSCHMTASAPQRSQISPLFEANPPAPGSEEWMRWFQNLRCGESFDKRTLATDFSLQLAISLQNFRAWRNEGSQMLAARYKSKRVPARIKPERPTAPHTRMMHDAENAEEVDIRRNYPRSQGP